MRLVTVEMQPYRLIGAIRADRLVFDRDQVEDRKHGIMTISSVTRCFGPVDDEHPSHACKVCTCPSWPNIAHVIVQYSETYYVSVYCTSKNNTPQGKRSCICHNYFRR